MGKAGRRQYHLTVTADLWSALVAEAERCGVAVSVVVRERLRTSFGLGVERAGTLEGPEGLGTDMRRYRCRLSLEGWLWHRLAEEAGARGLPVAMLIRERLRLVVADPRKGEIQPRAFSPTSETPQHGGAKTISLFDLSD